MISLYSQGQLQQALDQAKDLIEQFPHSILSHNICGAVYAAFNQYDAAIDSYKQALKIKPDYQSARSLKLHNQSHICDWAAIKADQDLVPKLGTTTQYIDPFAEPFAGNHTTAFPKTAYQ